MTSFWVSKNSSSDILILGGSNFFDFQIIYLLFNTVYLKDFSIPKYSVTYIIKKSLENG